MVTQACALFGLPEPKFYETDPDDSGYAATQRAVKDGAQLVVIAGGDGTARAAAKVLYNTDVQMGIIPTGTGNLLARNLNLPINDVHSCISIAFNGQSRAVDVVSLDMLHDDDTWDNQVSVVIAGAGYDAQIMHSTSDRLQSSCRVAGIHRGRCATSARQTPLGYGVVRWEGAEALPGSFCDDCQLRVSHRGHQYDPRCGD